MALAQKRICLIQSRRPARPPMTMAASLARPLAARPAARRAARPARVQAKAFSDVQVRRGRGAGAGRTTAKAHKAINPQRNYPWCAPLGAHCASSWSATGCEGEGGVKAILYGAGLDAGWGSRARLGVTCHCIIAHSALVSLYGAAPPDPSHNTAHYRSPSAALRGRVWSLRGRGGATRALRCPCASRGPAGARRRAARVGPGVRRRWSPVRCRRRSASLTRSAAGKVPFGRGALCGEVSPLRVVWGRRRSTSRQAPLSKRKDKSDGADGGLCEGFQGCCIVR